MSQDSNSFQFSQFAPVDIIMGRADEISQTSTLVFFVNGKKVWPKGAQREIRKPFWKKLDTPDLDLNPDLLVIGRLFYRKSSALDHAAIEAGDSTEEEKILLLAAVLIYEDNLGGGVIFTKLALRQFNTEPKLWYALAQLFYGDEVMLHHLQLNALRLLLAGWHGHVEDSAVDPEWTLLYYLRNKCILPSIC
uniref:Uncharacterized protein n=1 Tax=Timema douglasi TaxID=61478 RepID=A0A7R8VU23_TIMDO|nr:unnamed protein product [Timema douglasi]